jgi:hypothetical protein
VSLDICRYRLINLG